MDNAERKQLEIDMSHADNKCNRIVRDMAIIPVTEPVYKELKAELLEAQRTRRELGERHTAMLSADLARLAEKLDQERKVAG